MLRKTVSVIAIAAGLGLAPVAVAQAQTGTTNAPATTQPSAQPDATTPSTSTTPAPAAPGTSAQAPGTTAPAGESADTMDTGGTAGTTGTTADTSPASPPTTTGQTASTTDEGEGRVIDGQITMQSEGTYLGSDLIGTTVYSSGDESIGDINDVIIATNGTVEGVVVGVGGFLGIGQKDVAIQLDKVEMRDQGDNTVKLIVSSTKEELEQAPEFKTAADMRSEQESGNNAGTTGMAPAGGTGATGATGTTSGQ